ncbi:MAG: Ppx/GppA family phosphatase [Xanthobacteraceae bacterium]|nr:Ppx/GppA family phosphatase [Xanthobacteraceae bacterium]MBX3523672.1 Ppx/GppA family phosphatase [Xanthobacteraceae bacterium]MBX3534716.1 Ppx/GppA family phosphatase [Xanthobacteraceae bacterium]MBX3550038.1 Ppx/GppA family phosphatase [Xanthobacteraceae bacterium]MCW5674290.1 Ppx/GppA family phosphatase [Xanthobacteraceae bacterium]
MADQPRESAPGPQQAAKSGRRRRRRRGRGGMRGPQPGQPPRHTHYAALDLGTNNCRLLVASPTPDSFRVVDAFSRIVRLGEGLSRTGELSEAAQDRAIAALKICAAKLESRKVTRTRLIATEACRGARNGSNFLERVARETGLQLEIVNRETEAKLAANSCAPLLDRTAAGAILFDIGGGSSELAWLGKANDVDGGPPLAPVQEWDSMPLGVVTLAERFGGENVTPEIFDAMVEDVLPRVNAFAEKANGARNGEIYLLGTSGTVTTLAGIHLELPRYDRRRVDGIWLSRDEVTKVVATLCASSYQERVANPCIGAQRADLVLAGCAILEAIRRVFPCERLRVADRGLREGMLVELMRADGVWRR